MAISQDIAAYLPKGQKASADEILADDSIDLYKAPEGWIDALVETDSRYNVRIKASGTEYLYSCTCAFYRANAPTPCQHILAAVSAAEAGGWIDALGRATQALQNAAARPGFRDKFVPIGAMSAGGLRILETIAAPVAIPSWKPILAKLNRKEVVNNDRHAAWPPNKQIVYVIDVPQTLERGGVVVHINSREQKNGGEWRKLVRSAPTSEVIDNLIDPADRELLTMLNGTQSLDATYYGSNSSSSRRQLTRVQAALLVPRMCATGRCMLKRGQDGDSLTPLQWDAEGWDLQVVISRDEKKSQYLLGGILARNENGTERQRPLTTPAMLTEGGLVFDDEHVAPLNDHGAFEWVAMLRSHPCLRVPFKQADELLAEFYRLPALPGLNLPPELKVEEVHFPARPRLHMHASTERYAYPRDILTGDLSFQYGDDIIKDAAPSAGLYKASQRKLIKRDLAAENAAAERMKALGFRRQYSYGTRTDVLTVKSKALPKVIRTLIKEGWHVEADGKLYRQPGEIKIDVTSGIDWFDLEGNVQFGEQSASLPQLLAALRKGDSVVQLGDGTFGIMPEEWLKKYAPLAGVGTPQGEKLRFRPTQVGLLDALLASQPQVTCDETFARARTTLREFAGVEPMEAPPSFEGALRPYQCEALGWFDFLRKFGFGGCLADDMGLGKTVQVLALLDSRRKAAASGDSAQGPRKDKRPSMVVVPRSLVFNWQQEASRFAPGLRILDHSASNRPKTGEHFGDYDLVITTYGTLRRDVAYVKDVEFDYLILDEAQAIKNAASESAKSARLLHGDHRLVLSGTPVQNHLGDLWSLFEFLNPGMLGSATIFAGGSGASRTADPEIQGMLSRGLRPFILRRTKEQVATELPQKLEQTIHCDMEPAQRKLYDELREHYRQSLLRRVEAVGINRAKIQILEALLRLRQAACHPGLIDKNRREEPSAKLDMLLPRLAEVTQEGHKALVFSQFTSMLAIVRARLDAEGICYEYLDGKTRDRESKVTRFQDDPKCRLFLISLKAGGVGLNLTAADYVFLLDPWWNPAVESQAIDRTHRIGQTKQVFAYRLIARNTVEEKVLALQKTKRDLADAIINADNSLIRTLGREDLELLLS